MAELSAAPELIDGYNRPLLSGVILSSFIQAAARGFVNRKTRRGETESSAPLMLRAVD